MKTFRGPDSKHRVDVGAIIRKRGDIVNVTDEDKTFFFIKLWEVLAKADFPSDKLIIIPFFDICFAQAPAADNELVYSSGAAKT